MAARGQDYPGKIVNHIWECGLAGSVAESYDYIWDAIDGDSELNLTAGKSGTRFVLYSGQPQGDPIVSHGPFIADTQEDISRLYREFRTGKMKHISTVAESQKFNW